MLKLGKVDVFRKDECDGKALHGLRRTQLEVEILGFDGERIQSNRRY